MKFARSSERRLSQRPCHWLAWVLIALIALPLIGCSSRGWIRERRQPALPLAKDLQLFSWRGPQATPRTVQLLRRNDLVKRFNDNPQAVLASLLEDSNTRNSPETVFAVAEVAFIAARVAADDDRPGDALDLYGISVAHSYAYLLSDEFASIRNPYDPQFRQASDLYNAALESVMRVVAEQGELKPGTAHVITTRTQEYELHVVSRGPWKPDDLKELKFVSDYDLQGLKNHYRTYGLGVPLIGVHNPRPGNSPAEMYYAPGMSVPVTAFLRVLPNSQLNPMTGCLRHTCVLELHDPLRSDELTVNDHLVPLETDLSTPLAYSLNNATFQQANVATRGLLNPEKSQEHQGLYLLEPYDPDKIPVLMIHGLWSNLVTWMEMFNDLRATEEIRDHYQFWFYLYPSGQPLLLTATQLRQDLQKARRTLRVNSARARCSTKSYSSATVWVALLLDCRQLKAAMTIGHWSATRHWMSWTYLNRPDQNCEQALYFHPTASVKRVVTIASPHRGSAFSNGATQWFGRRLINLPEMFERTREQLLLANRERGSRTRRAGN